MTPLPGPRGNPPVNTVAPVATGSMGLGNVLTTTLGTWVNNPVTYLYQWQRNGVDIPGAIFASYTCVNADLTASVRCLITAFNIDGAGYGYSNIISQNGPSLKFNISTNSQYTSLLI